MLFCTFHISGGLDKLTGGGDEKEGAKTDTGEDPEVVQARLEAEERRQDKHRKMERERENMRQNIRDKVISLKNFTYPFSKLHI